MQETMDRTIAAKIPLQLELENILKELEATKPKPIEAW